MPGYYFEFDATVLLLLSPIKITLSERAAAASHHQHPAYKRAEEEA